MIFFLTLALIASVPALFFFRKQLAGVIMLPGIILALYFLIASHIFGVAHQVPIFEFDYGAMPSYYFSLIVIIAYAYGIFFGFCIPAKLSGLCFSQSAIMIDPAKRIKKGFSKNRGIAGDFALLLVSILPAAVILFSADISDLFARSTFPLRSISGFSMGLADTLFWPALITIAITSRRWMQAISLTFTVMMFAAAGERQAFVALLAFVLLDRFFLGRRCVVHYFIAIFSVWLLSALIFLRYEWTGGLYNVLVALFSFDSGLLDFVIFSVNYMSVFSVTSITASIESFSVDPIPFMYAINPLPSFFVSGWHEFSGVMSVRANVPYAALAMIYNNLGLPGVFLVGFIVGIFAFAIFLFKRRVNIVSLLLLVAFFLVPYLFGLQYNLRAYSRLLYFIGISLLAYQFFFRRVRIRLKG